MKITYSVGTFLITQDLKIAQFMIEKNSLGNIITLISGIEKYLTIPLDVIFLSSINNNVFYE